jgi:hypothetical protein
MCTYLQTSATQNFNISLGGMEENLEKEANTKKKLEEQLKAVT